MPEQAATRPSSKTPKKVRQACDPCHARKVRCDGYSPCANCRAGDTACTYLAVRHKTGPKGPRLRRMAPVFNPQRSKLPASAVISILPSRSHVGTGTNNNQLREFDNVNGSTTICRNDALEDKAFQPSVEMHDHVIRWCLEAFFKHKHPITPILHRGQLEQSLDSPPMTPENYSLFVSCCSVISLSPEILSPAPQPGWSLPSTDFLITETLRARMYCDLTGTPSLTHIRTSFFLFSSFFCLGKDNAAWYYLREAIAMLQTLRLHKEATYMKLSDPVQKTYSRRMFWTLYTTERAYALQRHRPLTLRNTLALPAADAMTTDAEVLPGLLDLISLFWHFDAGFIETWNSVAPPHSLPANSKPMSRLQDALKRAVPSMSGYSEMQQADFLISRQWLKIMVWQFCVSRTLLFNAGSEESMSLHYPVTIARDAVLVSHLLPVKALEANGVGILEKIFDIGCSLADLLVISSSTRHASRIEVSPVETLFEIVKILGTTLGGSCRNLNVLTDKVGRCLLLDIAPSLPLQLESGAEDMYAEDKCTDQCHFQGYM